MSKIYDVIQSTRGYPKLTKWKNEPTVQDLRNDLQEANSSYSVHCTSIQHWLEVLNPPPFKTKDPSRSKVQPKLARKQAEWRYAALSEPFLSTPDIFKVKPVSFEDTLAAEQNQLVLNNQFNTKLNKVKFIDDLVRTVVNEGTAVVRVGWEYSETEVEKNIPVYQIIPYTPEVDPKGSIIDGITKLMKLWNDPIGRKSVPDEWVQATEINTAQKAQIDQMQQQLEQLVQEAEQNGQPIPPEQLAAFQAQIPQFTPVFPLRVNSELKQVPVVVNQPTLQVCKYTDILIDPSCRDDLSKAEFVIYKFETSLAELKKSGKYKNLDKIKIDDLPPSEVMEDLNEDGTRGSFNFKDEARKRIVAYEYWGNWDVNKNKTTKPIVATWVGDIMIQCEENPFPDGEVPFVLFRYLPVSDNIFGEPDSVLLEDNQATIGALMRGSIDLLAKSANSQTGVAKGALDKLNRTRFDKGMDYEFNMNVDPRIAIYQHTFPELPQSVLAMLQIQQSEADAISGVRAFATSAVDATQQQTASQVRGALDAASKREMGILRRLIDGMVKVARKIIAMNGEFLSEFEILRITNGDFVTIRRDDLPGNFDLEIDISTNEQDDVKAQELAFMLQTLGQDMDPAMRNLILSGIAKLRKMPELAKRIENFEPTPDPIAIEIQQEQLKNWKLLNAKLEMECQKLQADAQLSIARAQAEQANVYNSSMEAPINAQLKQAQAENLHAKSLKDNLDFYEQREGITHEREMAKQGAQAQANLDRDIKKAMLMNSLKGNSRQKENVGSTNTAEPFNPEQIISTI